MGMFLRKGRVGGGSLVGLLLLLQHGKRRDDQQDNTWTCGTYQVCVERRTANITARVRFSLVPIGLTVSKNHVNTLFYDQKSRPDKTFSPHAPKAHTPPRHSLMIKPLPRVLNTSLQQ